MGVTHVIRGDDHLNNAARQTLIYRAMGWETPVWAHLPLIHGPDGAKLSKRHGAQAVSEFDAMGYLPEAMRNYLARLGWGHRDDEIFNDEQAAAWFDVVDVVSAPARLDWAKLNHINNHYIRQAEIGRLAKLVADIHRSRDFPARCDEADILQRTIPFVRDGSKTLLELADQTVFALIRRPLALSEKARAGFTDEVLARLGRLRDALGAEPHWNASALEARLRAFAEGEGVGLGKVGPHLRAAISGGSPAPDLAGALVSLGKAESLGRLDDALSSRA
jgi:glutamyl-tRNA synthetase